MNSEARALLLYIELQRLKHFASLSDVEIHRELVVDTHPLDKAALLDCSFERYSHLKGMWFGETTAQQDYPILQIGRASCRERV